MESMCPINIMHWSNISDCISSNLQNNIQQHIPHWRWKRWYETWLCIRQIGQIKSKEASSSTRASAVVSLNTYYSLSSWLSHFTTLLVVLSVMPFGKYDFYLIMLDNVNELCVRWKIYIATNNLLIYN